MKNILRLLGLSALVSTMLSADLMRVEMGAGMWNAAPSGETTYSEGAGNGSDVSLENEVRNPYVWLLLKHPIPVVPNIRLEYANVESNGIATGRFEDFIAANSNTYLNVKQYDVIPYYNILDNTAWATLDLGLDIKVLDVSYRADGVAVIGGGTTYTESEMIAIPLLYARTRAEIPATNIGVEADAKFVKYDDSTVYDARIKVDYTLDFIPVVQPAVEVGYRVQKYDIKDADIAGKMNLDFSGVYMGAMVRF